MPSAQSLPRWLCLAVVLASSSAHATDAKTLTRFHDPVVVAASRLPQFLGRSTAKLALHRIRGDLVEPMAYQFDPRGRDGGIDVGASRDFILDDNDELVFMAKDTGDRANGSADAIEIEVEDPRDGGRGWAYLMTRSTDEPPDASSPLYVRFDVARRRATSPLYEIEYADGYNFLTALHIAPDAGGNGENLLRQTSMLGEPKFSLLFGDVSLKFTERNSIVQVDGVRSGPVRAVRRVRLSVDLGPLFPDLPNGTVHTFHYFSSYTTPTKMSVPWLALKALRDFRFENLFEFAPSAAPRRYWDGANPAGVDFGAIPDGFVTDRDHDWWAVECKSGSLLQAFVVPQEWSDWGVIRGSALEAAGAGFTLRDMIRLQRSGSYDLMQSTVILPRGYRPGDEREVMGMFHTPLRVHVRAAREREKNAGHGD